jgi:formylglycine-generating enzyme required for sulfatase activity
MRLILASAALGGLCLLLAQGQAQAQSSARCGNFYTQVNAAAAQRDRAALERLIDLPAAQQCKPEAETARNALARLASPPVAPPVVPPVAPPIAPPTRTSPLPPPIARDVEADVFAAADTCAEMRDYQARYRNGRFRAQAQAFLNSETCTPRSSPPAPVRVSPPPPPRPPTLADGQTFRDCADCPEMVVIPAGSFVMGSPEGEKDRGTHEGPQRTVSISRFAAGKFEVTFDEWAACAAGGGCRANANPGDQGWGRGRRPVINVSWNHAQEYVQWLSQKTGQRYRLLTEAEWEYAARAGTTGPWIWGSDPNGGCGFANHADMTAKRENSGWTTSTCEDGVAARTTTVGRYQSNNFGLYDVIGNVWEWTQDCYVNTYSGAPTNGSAVTTGDCSSRVLRGGSWNYDPPDLRSADRNGRTPTDRRSDFGFRLARTVSPPNR